jgi:hypothetical protein
MILAEAVQIPEKQICSKTITTHIPISFDAVRCPELPTTTVMFRIGLTFVCLSRTYVSPLSSSAVSSHVVVLLLILGSV